MAPISGYNIQQPRYASSTQQRRSVIDSPNERQGTIARVSYEKDYSAQNRQQATQIVNQAKQAGATKQELAQLQQRLLSGRFEVANVDPAKALNIQEHAQSLQSQALNTLLGAALKELNDVQSDQEKQVKLSHLVNSGEVADYDATSQTYVTFSTQQEKQRDLVDAVQIQQNMTQVDAQGQGKTTTRIVNPKEIDALAGSQFDVLEVNETRKLGTLSTDQKHLSSLRQVIESDDFSNAYEQSLKGMGSYTADQFAQHLAPLQSIIAGAYDMQGVQLEIADKGPDNGVTLALYNPESGNVMLYTPAIKTLEQQGRQKGFTGEALKRYTLNEITKTLAHENRHAYQYAAVQDPDAFGLTEADTQDTDALRTNMHYYNIPLVDQVLTGNMNAYKDQPLEYGVRQFEDLASTLLHQRSDTHRS